MINYFHLFKYTDTCDKVLLGIGISMGIISGALMPSVAIVMGKVVSIFDP
jgi:ABC-type multidrug transport system fused ATPase/permease subunit